MAICHPRAWRFCSCSRFCSRYCSWYCSWCYSCNGSRSVPAIGPAPVPGTVPVIDSATVPDAVPVTAPVSNPGTIPGISRTTVILFLVCIILLFLVLVLVPFLRRFLITFLAPLFLFLLRVSHLAEVPGGAALDERLIHREAEPVHVPFRCNSTHQNQYQYQYQTTNSQWNTYDRRSSIHSQWHPQPVASIHRFKIARGADEMRASRRSNNRLEGRSKKGPGQF